MDALGPPRLRLRLVRSGRPAYEGPLRIAATAPCWVLSHVVQGDVLSNESRATGGWLMVHPPHVPFRERADGAGRHEFLFLEVEGVPEFAGLPDAFPLRDAEAFREAFDEAVAGRGLALARLAGEALASFEVSGLPPRAASGGASRFAPVAEALRERSLSRGEMAAMAGLDPNHFDRAYRGVYGEPPAATARRHRLDRLKARLAGTDHDLDSLARAEGLAEASSLIRFFRGATGETPARYRSRVKTSIESYVRSFEREDGDANVMG